MALDIIQSLTQMGWLLAIVLVWDLVWKLMAMWRASRKHSIIWFVVLMIFNTAGILPILYLYVFSKIKLPKKEEEPVKRKRTRKAKRKKRR